MRTHLPKCSVCVYEKERSQVVAKCVINIIIASLKLADFYEMNISVIKLMILRNENSYLIDPT